MRGDRPRAAWVARVARVAGIVVVIGFVGLYVYNSLRHNVASLRGDQWFWVTHVVVPFDDGRMSLFDAVTFEYQSFAHSHIPTLIVFLATYRWLNLTPTVDMLVGIVSLCGVLVVAWRHCASIPSRAWMQLGLVAAASIVFMSSSTSNFVWSLLQFQMFYVFVAVLYLYLFGQRVEPPAPWFAVWAIPTAMVMGDAIGAAAVAASLLYLLAMVVIRRVPWKSTLVYFVVFAVALIVLGPLLRGQRQHGGSSSSDFVDGLVSQSGDVVKSFYYAVAQGFVGLHSTADSVALIRWDAAWLWFVVSGCVLAGIAVGLRRVGLERTDHFPLMLMLASLIWTLGVVRARALVLGPAALQAERYATYTAMLGFGAVILVAAKGRALDRLRPVVATALVVVIAANLVGSITVSLDDRGEQIQDGEVARLRAYVEGERPDAPSLGLACSDWSPCLEAAWFLWDRKLGPFADDGEPRAPWLLGYRDALYGRYHAAGDAEKDALCAFVAGASIDELIADIRSGDGLAPRIAANGVEVPDDASAEAAEILQQAMATKCLSRELQSRAANPTPEE